MTKEPAPIAKRLISIDPLQIIHTTPRSAQEAFVSNRVPCNFPQDSRQELAKMVVRFWAAAGFSSENSWGWACVSVHPGQHYG